MKFLGRHLMLKGIYAEKLLKGEKKATIRKGIVKPKYAEVIVHAGGRPIAKIKITRVYYKKVSELGDYEARLEGYESVDELLRDLKRAYGDLKYDDYVTVIEFEVVQRLDELKHEDPYFGLEPADVARLALRYLSRDLSEFEIDVLMDLTRTNSIRKTAVNIFKDLNKRRIVRRILRKALKMLAEKGLIGFKPGAEKDVPSQRG
ncbi:MAG: ASCH domain-containing protein [Desulfurococcaceae archaeon]